MWSYVWLGSYYYSNSLIKASGESVVFLAQNLMHLYANLQLPKIAQLSRIRPANLGLSDHILSLIDKPFALATP